MVTKEEFLKLGKRVIIDATGETFKKAICHALVCCRFDDNVNVDLSFKELDEILLKYAPNISYFQYKEIEDKVVTTIDIKDGYYGDYEAYIVRVLNIEYLYDFLKDANLLI